MVLQFPSGVSEVQRRLNQSFRTEPVLRDALSTMWHSGLVSKLIFPILVVRRKGDPATSPAIASGLGRAIDLPTRYFNFGEYLDRADDAELPHLRARIEWALRQFGAELFEAASSTRGKVVLGIEIPRRSDLPGADAFVRALYEVITEFRVQFDNRIVDLSRSPMLFFFDAGDGLEVSAAGAIDRFVFADTTARDHIPKALINRFGRVVFTTGTCQGVLLKETADPAG